MRAYTSEAWVGKDGGVRIFFFNIYLAVLALSCSTKIIDLRRNIQDLSVVVCEFLVAARGI